MKLILTYTRICNRLIDKRRPAFYSRWDAERKEKITINITYLKMDGAGNLFVDTNGLGGNKKRAGFCPRDRRPWLNRYSYPNFLIRRI